MSMAAIFEARRSFAPASAEARGFEQQAPESGIRTIVPDRDEQGNDPKVSRIQDQFIDNWARMASAFAMERMTGRVHALLYISEDPLDLCAIAYKLRSPTHGDVTLIIRIRKAHIHFRELRDLSHLV